MIHNQYDTEIIKYDTDIIKYDSEIRENSIRVFVANWAFQHYIHGDLCIKLLIR